MNNKLYDLVQIDESAFEGSLLLSGSLTSGNKLLTIKSRAFFQCINFDGNLTFNTGIKTIEERAFTHDKFTNNNLIIPVVLPSAYKLSVQIRLLKSQFPKMYFSGTMHSFLIPMQKKLFAMVLPNYQYED
ncbi:MAG: leucine-rich repeat domain-containing protein [Mycoplasmataceae bacterium]|jgi:hypothetical protein|nr:leucine-rich repeat domain-containing protein [Mycoplasmataceae bacterium]